MKQLSISILLILLFRIADSQVPTVIYQQETQGFDGGISLPAQKPFVISGDISEIITKVEVNIYTNSTLDKLFYTAIWSGNITGKSTTFKIPVNKLLRSNEEYSFELSFYTRVEKQEHLQLVDMLQNSLSEYVNAQTRIKREQLIFNKPPDALVNELNAIVRSAFKDYDLEMFRFSGIVTDKIKQIESLKIKTERDDINEVSTLYELKNLLDSEIRAYLPQEINKLVYKTIIQDYPTQKLPNVLGVNLGYGATFIEKDNIGYAPYAGLSIPLGNLAFAPFMSRVSVSAGIFLSDIKDENNVIYTGPVIKKPIYVGLGYRFLDFVRLNAGAGILEKSTAPATTDIFIRPYIGLSIDLNLWIGLGKQRPVPNN